MLTLTEHTSHDMMEWSVGMAQEREELLHHVSHMCCTTEASHMPVTCQSHVVVTMIATVLGVFRHGAVIPGD